MAGWGLDGHRQELISVPLEIWTDHHGAFRCRHGLSRLQRGQSCWGHEACGRASAESSLQILGDEFSLLSIHAVALRVRTFLLEPRPSAVCCCPTPSSLATLSVQSQQRPISWESAPENSRVGKAGSQRVFSESRIHGAIAGSQFFDSLATLPGNPSSKSELEVFLSV